jgi:hypothetical protein
MRPLQNYFSNPNITTLPDAKLELLLQNPEIWLKSYGTMNRNGA